MADNDRTNVERAVAGLERTARVLRVAAAIARKAGRIDVRQLSEFPPVARETKYPWARIFNGNIWQLKKGTDFHSEANSFRTTAYAAARRYGVSIRSAAVDKDTVVIQAQPKGGTK